MRIAEKLARLATRKAAGEVRSLGDLIEDALEQYLNKSAATPTERWKAYHFFCERPMKLPREQLRYVLDEDTWGEKRDRLI